MKNKKTISIDQPRDENSVKTSIWLNFYAYKKLTLFAAATNGKYQTMLNEILVENVDNYIKRKATSITEELNKYTKKSKAN